MKGARAIADQWDPRQSTGSGVGPTMKAVAYTAPAGGLIELDMPVPEPAELDLLIEVRAVAINPCDVKAWRYQDPRVLGFDAAGVVRAKGGHVSGFDVGEEVWYAGSIIRQGANSELQLVDSRLAARKPVSLSFAEAAAMPLTTLTAWEALFDRMWLPADGSGQGALLIIGGSGGVGSMAVQLAAQLSGLTVVATAGTAAGLDWCRAGGAHHVINHRDGLESQAVAFGHDSFKYMVVAGGSDRHWSSITNMIAPHGDISIIDDPVAVDFRDLKPKCVSMHWQAVFARPRLQTADMALHGKILESVAALVDEGRLKSTLVQQRGGITASHLMGAYTSLEESRTPGKIVLEGFN